jgi:hypothetical protein
MTDDLQGSDQDEAAAPGEAAPDESDLNPPLTPAELPPQVLGNRQAQAANEEVHKRRLEPRIDAHIAAHALALDFLEQTHQAIADRSDLDLIADTRPAAVWQMAGRCIGIARLILDALQLGYAGEVVHLARALHEADRLLEMFEMPGEADLLRRWLADEDDSWVRPWEARAAERRFEERLAEAMLAAGEKEIESTLERTRDIYDKHSQAAHHRRRWTQDAVSAPLRSMIRGRAATPWVRRAATTASLVSVVEETTISVGDALSHFQSAGWYEDQVKPFIQSFEALRQTVPLD